MLIVNPTLCSIPTSPLLHFEAKKNRPKSPLAEVRRLDQSITYPDLGLLRKKDGSWDACLQGMTQKSFRATCGLYYQACSLLENDHKLGFITQNQFDEGMIACVNELKAFRKAVSKANPKGYFVLPHEEPHPKLIALEKKRSKKTTLLV